MSVKQIIGQIHLWLGFVAGTIVVVSMLAAALFVWDEELTSWYYHDYYYANPNGKTALPLDTLFKTAQGSVPGKDVSYVQISRDPNRTYAFRTFKRAEHPGFSWMSSMDYSDKVYVNQYTGKTVGTVDMRYDWITMTRMLHQCLLINYDIGHLIVGIMTLMVMVLVLTGVVLWWPKNKAALRQRFSIKWNARWKRVNYDIHNVGGFYCYLVVLLLAITGLVWTFDWWTHGIYRIMGNDPKEIFAKHEPPAMAADTIHHPAQRVLADVALKRTSWETINLNFPKSTKESPGEYSAFVRFDDDNGWDESDTYYYHGTTGTLHHTRTHEQKLLGEKWRNSNYAIHVGSIYGLPTKILASFAGLFLASLPVTGFLIWLGRRNKKKKDEPLARSRAGQITNRTLRQPVRKAKVA